MTSDHHPTSLRLFVGAEVPLHAGQVMDLPDLAARHAQVRRVQPGDSLMLFDGRGDHYLARIANMGRQQVAVEIGAAVAAVAELAVPVTLAVVIPANERMDGVVEKATELGTWSIQPLMSTRSAQAHQLRLGSQGRLLDQQAVHIMGGLEFPIRREGGVGLTVRDEALDSCLHRPQWKNISIHLS